MSKCHAKTVKQNVKVICIIKKGEGKKKMSCYVRVTDL
jgi:hypothetical protein